MRGDGVSGQYRYTDTGGDRHISFPVVICRVAGQTIVTDGEKVLAPNPPRIAHALGGSGRPEPVADRGVAALAPRDTSPRGAPSDNRAGSSRADTATLQGRTSRLTMSNPGRLVASLRRARRAPSFQALPARKTVQTQT